MRRCFALGTRVAGALVVLFALVAVLPSARAESDVTAPVLQSFARMSPATVGPGDTVRMAYAASDVGVGLRAVTFEFTTPIGASFSVRISGAPEESGEAFATVLANAPAGTYQLTQIFVDDAAGNYSTYGRNGRVETYPNFTFAAHSLHLASADFAVVNPNGDASTAVLSGLSRTSPAIVQPGDVAAVAFTASDQSGPPVVRMYYAGPIGNELTLVSFDGASPAARTIGTTVPAGHYQLVEVALSDHALTQASYRRDETIAKHPEGALGATMHAFDFAAADFDVVNANGDITTPILTALTPPESRTFVPGELVSVAYSANDASGVALVDMYFTGPLGNGLHAYGRVADGAAIVRIPPAVPSGTYQLASVSLLDAVSNYVIYGRDGTAARSPAGALGPLVHAFDFARFDFTVDNGEPATTTTSSTTTTVPPEGVRQITAGVGSGGSRVKTFLANGVPSLPDFDAWPTRFSGGVPVARGDLDGDGHDEFIVGSGRGGNAFAVYGSDWKLKFVRRPYGAFGGGVNVAVGDVAGDGRPEIVVAPGAGGGPHVRVFNGAGDALGSGFFAYDPSFAGGVNVAVGRVTAIGKARIVTAPGPGGGPHVRAFTVTGAPVGGFFAYAPTFTGGVNVAVAQVDRGGTAAIITGPGAGGGPHVRVFDLSGREVSGFFAYAPSFPGGVRVAGGDLSGDGTAEVVVAPASGGAPYVKVFRAGGQLVRGFHAFEAPFGGGAYVAVGKA